jgi:5-methylcytosine-specific restriction endonuclease McrA
MRQETAEERQHRLEYQRRWREANPGYQKAYRHENREQISEDARARYAAEGSERRKRRALNTKIWKTSKCPKAREQKRWEGRSKDGNKRAEAHGQPGRVTAAQLKRVFRDYLFLCVYCLGPATETDHVVPLATGGAHHPDNIVSACSECNLAKGVKPLIIWLASRNAI